MWIKACREEDFRRIHKIVHRRKEIALFRLDDGIYATDNSCSHEYSELSQGEIIGDNVYCPKHGSRFDIRTGAVKDPPAVKPIKTYKVKIEDGVIYIKL